MQGVISTFYLILILASGFVGRGRELGVGRWCTGSGR